MTRFQDWPARLATIMQDALRTPFAWGSHDCCTFAGASVVALTGEDPLRSFRGRWKTARGAARVLAPYGGLSAAVTSVLGQPVAPALAHRGDVLLLSERIAADGVCGIGVCFGATVGAPGEDGLLFFPVGDALACWRVGEA